MTNLNSDTPARRRVVISRVFNAPVELVWQAWTVPEHIMRWWGPDGFTSPLAKLDLREGGTSLVCMRAPQAFGGQDFYNTWHYTKIVPHERIEFIQNLSDENGNLADPVKLGLRADFPKDVHTVITFRDLGNAKTELTVTEDGFPEGQMYEFAELGLQQSLDKMASTFVTA